MITGVFKSDEARIRLKVIGTRGRKQEVEAVIDTGFTASLSLPPALVAALGLRWQSFDRGHSLASSYCEILNLKHETRNKFKSQNSNAQNSNGMILRFKFSSSVI